MFAYDICSGRCSVAQMLSFQRAHQIKTVSPLCQTVARYMQLDRRANCSPSIDDFNSGRRAGDQLEASRCELS